MALQPCSECGRDVSTRAANCPHCGAPVSGGSISDPQTVHGRGEGLFMKSLNCGCMVILAFFALIVIAGIVGSMGL